MMAFADFNATASAVDNDAMVLGIVLTLNHDRFVYTTVQYVLIGYDTVCMPTVAFLPVRCCFDLIAIFRKCVATCQCVAVACSG
jgi:hypothetical protein